VTSLSGYRIMWMITLFDLPVVTKPDRKRAAAFRKFLLKQGFQMMQFSVYIKHCKDQVQIERLAVAIAHEVPIKGTCDIVTITDKQYENIVTFYGDVRVGRKNPGNLTLF
jgi:CRISPR-associated protein Cas2